MDLPNENGTQWSFKDLNYWILLSKHIFGYYQNYAN